MSTVREVNRHASFPQTLSGLVLMAADASDPDVASGALRRVCELYHQPLVSYARAMGCQADEAMDLTHDFIRGLLHKGSLGGYERQPGVRFRAWLLTCFKRHIWQSWNRARRSPVVGLRNPDALPETAMDAEETHQLRNARDAFELRCAVELLNHVTRRLREEHASRGQQESFDLLSPYLLGESAAPYEEVALKLGVPPGTARKRVHDMKQRWGELLREELWDECGSATRVTEEIRNLLAVFSRSG